MSNQTDTLNAASSGMNGTAPSPSSGNMSAAASPVSTADTAPTAKVVVVEDTAPSSSSPEYDPARRRRRRRRRRSVRNEIAERRMRFFLIITIGLLLFVALSGGNIRGIAHSVTDSVRNVIPVATIKSFFRLETFALLLAALILLYLMPGVEDRVLRLLGLKKDRRSSRR